MEPLLTSLDLFSGIGGITRALEGFARPIAYCEIDGDCQRVLEKHMKLGSLPSAPVHSDIRSLTAKTLGRKHVDVIMGGWPCQDLSTMGLRKGLEGERSGLIYEVFRLTDELKPSMLFLENVPVVLNDDGFNVIIEEFVVKRGYELRWALVTASSVGASHIRKRWFGMAVKPGFLQKVINLVWRPTEFRPFFPRYPKEPQRMIVSKNAAERSEHNHRAQMLGNSVVPDAVRSAFIILASGFETKDPPKALKNQEVRLRAIPNGVGTTQSERKGLNPAWGYAKPATGAQLFKVSRPTLRTPNLSLVFDPRVFKTKTPKRNVNEILRKREYATAWNTPRHTSFASNVMTARALHDLPSQTRFEINTPDHLRAGVLSPNFLEWMMGYPKDWTK